MDWFLKLFIKDYKNIESVEVRSRYGFFASALGAVCNLCLFLAKILIGISVNSVSIMADGFNNLSDMGSNAVVFLSFFFTKKPADAEHPYGHGRMEYISTLIVSVIIIFMSYELFRTSIDKMLNPEEMEFSIVAVCILFGSILLKLLMSAFYKSIGKRIKSSPLMAASFDSLSDVMTTSGILLSLLVSYFMKINIDAYVAAIVAVIIFIGGIKVAKEAVDLILGQPVNQELAGKIKQIILGSSGILGVHDLIVHSYGFGKTMATAHAEMPENLDFNEIHSIINSIEDEVLSKLGIDIVIRMDPVLNGDEKVDSYSHMLDEILFSIDGKVEKHSFRVVETKNLTKFVFELDVPFSYNTKKENDLLSAIQERLGKINDRFFCSISFDKSFTQKE